MKTKINFGLRRRQLDAGIKALKGTLPRIPKNGWIAEVRSLFGITSTQLAKRIGISQASLSSLEKSEVKRTISLSSLERVAEKLGCEVYYCLLPKESFEKTLYDRAIRVISKENDLIENTMALELQGTNKENVLSEDVQAAILMESLDRRLWEEKG